MKIFLLILLFSFIWLFAANSLYAQEGKVEFSLSDLEWIAGYWGMVTDSVEMEEIWTEPRGGIILGLHRDIFPEAPPFFEYLRIGKTPEGIFYFASPGGHQATPFKLVKKDSLNVTFENPENDFPQRIIYWREGDTLHARIEGERYGVPASRQWFWKKQE